MIQYINSSHFPICHFVRSCMPNLQIRRCPLTFYIARDFSTTSRFLFSLRAACKFWLASYILSRASQLLSGLTFCAYFKHKLKTLAATTLPHSKRLTYYQGCFISCHKQQSSYNLQAMFPYLHCCLRTLCTSTCMQSNKTQGTYTKKLLH